MHTLDVYLEAEYAMGSLVADESDLVGAAWLAEPPSSYSRGRERFAAFRNDE